MNRYVKKPIAIEAVKWKGFNNDEIKDFAGDSVKIEVIREGDADNGIPAVNIITNNADISFIIFRSIVSLIISPQL